MAERPIVAIVGRPNVGKSTLFNRIAGKRLALTEDVPGVTRDRHYASADWGEHQFEIVDTGGFVPRPDEPLIEMVRDQAQLAVDEAAMVVLVVDATEGVTPADREVAELLRRSGKPVLVAANKTDVKSAAPMEFHELGLGQVIGVSAEHGRGIADMLDAVVAVLPTPAAPEEAAPEDALRLAVVGRPNVGKSTFVNHLLGEERFVVSEFAGTTRDAVDARLAWRDRTVILTDTAGIRRKRSIAQRIESFSVVRAFRSLEQSDVAVVLMDATEPAVDQDLRIVALAEEKGCGLILVLNKWDLVPHDKRSVEKLREEVALRLPFVSWAPMLTVSAKEGFRVEEILDLALELHAHRAARVGTHELSEFLQRIQEEHPAPLWRGFPVKFFFMTQVAERPPTFTVTCNRPQAVTADYQRYVVNKLRAQFKLDVPVRVFYRPKGKK